MNDDKLEKLKTEVRERPLVDRLSDARHMIAQMCAKRRPPAMSLPARASDEDLFIVTTLQDAIAAITGEANGVYVALTMLPDHGLVVLCDPIIAQDVPLFTDKILAAWKDGGQHRLLRYLRPPGDSAEDSQAQFICRTETGDQAYAIARALNAPAKQRAGIEPLLREIDAICHEVIMSTGEKRLSRVSGLLVSALRYIDGDGYSPLICQVVTCSREGEHCARLTGICGRVWPHRTYTEWMHPNNPVKCPNCLRISGEDQERRNVQRAMSSGVGCADDVADLDQGLSN